MTAGDTAPIYWDSRDLTPFGQPQLRTPVHDLAGGVGDILSGVLGGRHPALLSVDGEVPRLKRMLPRPAKAVHEAIFTSREPERLITLARSYPGWAGLCYLMAGLLAYKQGGYLRASELLQRGLTTRNDDDANRYSATYLTRIVTRIELAERVEVPVLFSEESVFLALAHSLRETGRTEAALDALGGLPPSLPMALARCSLALSLGRSRTVIDWTEGLLNADDLSAALLLVRARALRREGRLEAAHQAIAEVLRRRKTHMVLRNDALTDRALLVLDTGRRSLNPRDWGRRREDPVPQKEIAAPVPIRKDEEMRRIWEQDWKKLSDE
jgi:tetratricopeptide (TPR) repeat protein